VAGKHFVLIERVGITAATNRAVHSIGVKQANINMFRQFDAGAESRICGSG
jgi:hypothetical protein